MPTWRAWCEHQASGICSEIPQTIFTSSPLSLSDFSTIPWYDYEVECVISLLRGPIEGLANLHVQGYMHRDVHAKNLFVLSLEPPKAVLGDFGKTVAAVSSQSAHLGPKHTCAPEVNGTNWYNNSIDIWSMGIVCLEVLAPDKIPKPGYPPTETWWNCTMKTIDERREQQPGSFPSVFASMI
ncbi:hypothetical protein XPA_010435 [Xanthoria parietina]